MVFSLCQFIFLPVQHTPQRRPNQYIHIDIETFEQRTSTNVHTPTTDCNNSAERSSFKHTYASNKQNLREFYFYTVLCLLKQTDGPKLCTLITCSAATVYIYEHIMKRWRVHRGAYTFHKVPKFTVESFQIIATQTGFSNVYLWAKYLDVIFFIRSVGIVYVVFLFGGLLYGSMCVY